MLARKIAFLIIFLHFLMLRARMKCSQNILKRCAAEYASGVSAEVSGPHAAIDTILIRQLSR